MSKKRQKEYDKLKDRIQSRGIQIWGYAILDIDKSHLDYSQIKCAIKNTPIKLRKSDNGVEYLIGGKNE